MGQTPEWFKGVTVKSGLKSVLDTKAFAANINSDKYSDFLVISGVDYFNNRKTANLFINEQNPSSSSHKDRVFVIPTEDSGINANPNAAVTGLVITALALGFLDNDGLQDLIVIKDTCDSNVRMVFFFRKQTNHTENDFLTLNELKKVLIPKRIVNRIRVLHYDQKIDDDLLSAELFYEHHLFRNNAGGIFNHLSFYEGTPKGVNRNGIGTNIIVCNPCGIRMREIYTYLCNTSGKYPKIRNFNLGNEKVQIKSGFFHNKRALELGNQAGNMISDTENLNQNTISLNHNSFASGSFFLKAVPDIGMPVIKRIVFTH
jgi:hypothetical protein